MSNFGSFFVQVSRLPKIVAETKRLQADEGNIVGPFWLKSVKLPRSAEHRAKTMAALYSSDSTILDILH